MTDISPDYIAKVINAAPFADNVAGIPQIMELIRALHDENDRLRADAGAAVALVIEQAASTGYRICAETRHVTLGRQVEDAIRRLAPTAGIEALAALRDELDVTDRLLKAEAEASLVLRAERGRLATENADLQRRVEELQAILTDAGALRDAADRVSEWFMAKARHLEGPRIQGLRVAMVAYDRHMQPNAALTPADPGKGGHDG